jgi:DNA-binding HxlR family transcriptional regulator
MKLNVHVFTSGESNYNTFRKTIVHYQNVSRIIILREDSQEDIQDIHSMIEKECYEYDIDYQMVTYEKDSLEDEVIKIMSIRKELDEANLYFNITGGKKTAAIMAVISSIWVDGVVYYWEETVGDSVAKNPIELPIPKVSVNDLAKNQLHLNILGIISKNKRINQTKLKEKIGKNPNNNKELSPQTLSQSLRYLEKYELIKRERMGRETNIETTLSGRLAYSMIKPV